MCPWLLSTSRPPILWRWRWWRVLHCIALHVCPSVCQFVLPCASCLSDDWLYVSMYICLPVFASADCIDNKTWESSDVVNSLRRLYSFIIIISPLSLSYPLPPSFLFPHLHPESLPLCTIAFILFLYFLFRRPHLISQSLLHNHMYPLFSLSWSYSSSLSILPGHHSGGEQN